MDKRILVKLILLLLLVGGAVYSFVHFDLIFLFTDKDKIIDLINSFGPLSALAFIGVQILQVMVAPIPGELTGIIGGYLFGPLPGFLYSTVGLTLGSWAAFALGRFFGLPFVEKAVKPDFIRKYDYVMEHQGVLISFVLFLIPGFPKDYLCYILGLSHLHLWKFLVVSTVGRLFGTALLSFSGSLARAHQIAPLLMVLAFTVFVLIITFLYRERLLAWLKRRHHLSVHLHQKRGSSPAEGAKSSRDRLHS